MALNPDMARAHLQEVHDAYFSWLRICVGVVVMGVALEGPEAWREFQSAFSREIKHHGRWIPALAFAGWILVVIGLAGEIVFETLVSQSDGTIRTFDANLIKAARIDTVAARGQADAARSETAKLNVRAKEAELELFRLQQKQIPRRLSDQQKRDIARGLSRFNGQYAQIEFQTFSPELKFAKDLVGALGTDGAKWNISDSPTMDADQVVGIKVKVNRFATSKTILASRALVGLLRSVGLVAVTGPDLSEYISPERRGPDDYAPTVQMRIIVGRRP